LPPRFIAGHQRAGLHLRRIVDPDFQVRASIHWRRPAPNRFTRHQMSEGRDRSGPSAAVPANGVWQLTHAVDSNTMRPCAAGGVEYRRLFSAAAAQRSKSARGSTITRSKHHRMLGATVTRRIARDRSRRPADLSTSNSSYSGSRRSYPPDAAPKKLWATSADIEIEKKSARDYADRSAGNMKFVGRERCRGQG